MNTQGFAMKEQQCSVIGLVLSWIVFIAGLIYLAYERRWLGGLMWLVIVPSMRFVLFRYFPSLSRFLGYGRIDDKIPFRVGDARVAVTFYGFFSCPFCPIVLKRLETLQREMNFTLQKIDVTLKPRILISKQIRSVPVVEVGGRRLVGNATSEELAALIGSAQPIHPRQAA